MMYRVLVRDEWCKVCGICQAFCTRHAITIKDNRVCVDYSLCNGCRMCEYRCPDLALRVEKERDDISETTVAGK